jgi:hypothetical protein
LATATNNRSNCSRPCAKNSKKERGGHEQQPNRRLATLYQPRRPIDHEGCRGTAGRAIAEKRRRHEAEITALRSDLAAVRLEVAELRVRLIEHEAAPRLRSMPPALIA